MKSNIEPKLGVHLLETITRGMYSEPMHSIREYVQNAFDSIRRARSTGVLDAGAGTIRIVLDQDNRSVRVEDDGTGLSPEEAVVWLLDIGRSHKALDDGQAMHNAGFRGIGRMAGISYCDKLLFETSIGDGRACSVKFDAARINALTRPGQEPVSISEAIGSSVNITEWAVECGRRFFSVELQVVDPRTGFMDQYLMSNYLSNVAPVSYDPQGWDFGDEVESMAAKFDSTESLESVRVVICDAEGHEQVEVRRPFCNTFEARSRNTKRSVTVNAVQPLPSDGEPGTGWWGWLAIHSREAKLGDVQFAGLRIRMHNIAIGDEKIVRSLFKTPHLALWCFGEVHITDPRVIPNAQRDAFEPSKIWSQIEDELRIEAESISRVCRKESQSRSSAKKKRSATVPVAGNDPVEAAGTASDETGSSSSPDTVHEGDTTLGPQPASPRIPAPVYQSTMAPAPPSSSDSRSNDSGTPPRVDELPRADQSVAPSTSHGDQPQLSSAGEVDRGGMGAASSSKTQNEPLESLSPRLRECLAKILPVLQEYFDDGEMLHRIGRGIAKTLQQESEV